MLKRIIIFKQRLISMRTGKTLKLEFIVYTVRVHGLIYLPRVFMESPYILYRGVLRMTATGLLVNDGKDEIVQAEDGGRYLCYAIRTPLVTAADKLTDVVREYAQPLMQKDDILFISEKMVACTQGRAIPMASIKPGFFARFLSRRVTKNSAGIGLSMPETMQCAIKECGILRILLAAFVGMVGKIFRRKGWFYHVAGYRAAGIDGPCEYTIPPLNTCVVLAPLKPDKTAKEVSETLGGNTVLIVDVNDLGANIMGNSHRYDEKNYVKLLRQNPLGQDAESTPMGILRPCPPSREK
jgi:hypothetical protein